MHKRLLSALAALAAALPLASHADTMDYSYGELGYLDSSLDDGFVDVDGDGFALRGSIAIQDTFFAFAEYQSLDFDFNVDATVLAIGGGGHWPLNDKLDIVARVGIVSAEVEVDNLFGRGFSVDDDGLMLGARLRAEVMPKLELEGGFDYRDLDVGDDTVVVAEGRYFFIDNLAGGVSIGLGDDSTTLGLNVRLTF